MLVTTRRLVAPALGLLFALTFTSCGKIVETAFEEGLEEAVERDSGEDVEIDFNFDDEDGSISISGDDGDVELSLNGDEDGTLISGTDEDGNDFSMSSSQDFPEDWPSEIPAPPGTAIGSTVMSDNSLSFVSVIMQTGNAMSDHESYLNTLTSSGFEVVSNAEFTTDGVKSVFTQASSSSWDVSLTATEDGDGQLVVTLQEKTE